MTTKLFLSATVAWGLALVMGTRASADFSIDYSFQIAGTSAAYTATFAETLSAGTYSYGGAGDGGSTGSPLYLGINGSNQTVLLSSSSDALYSVIVSGNTDPPGSNGAIGSFLSDAELDTVLLSGADNVPLTVISTQTGFTTPTGSNLLLTDTANSDDPSDTSQQNVNNHVTGALSASAQGQVIDANTSATLATASIATFTQNTPDWWEPQTATMNFANSDPFSLTSQTVVSLANTGDDVVLDNDVKVSLLPVPEPSTLATVGSGALAAAVVWAWRFRNRKKS